MYKQLIQLITKNTHTQKKKQKSQTTKVKYGVTEDLLHPRLQAKSRDEVGLGLKKGQQGTSPEWTSN